MVARLLLRSHILVAATILMAGANCAAAQEAVGPPLPVFKDVKTFVGTEVGYDSNLDNRVAARGSPYEMLQMGSSGTLQASSTAAYNWYLRGREYWYNELDTSHRYDFDIALGARFDVSSDMAVKTGVSYYRDKISINSADIYKAYADLVKESEVFRARLKLDSRTELSTASENQGALDTDVFEVARGKAFDYSKNGVTASLLMLRKQIVAPFFIANYSDIDYFHQAANPAINRSAREAWGVAGIRITLSSDLQIDLGMRHTHRQFEDQAFSEFSSSYFDGRLTWKLGNGLTAQGTVERQIKEPTTSFGLADDVITYEVRLDKKLDPWTFYGRAFLDHVRPIGENFDYFKYNWAGGAAYELRKDTEIYAEYSAKFVNEKVTSESYDRTRVGAGIRVKF